MVHCDPRKHKELTGEELLSYCDRLIALTKKMDFDILFEGGIR